MNVFRMFPNHITWKSDFFEISRETVIEFLHRLLKASNTFCIALNSWIGELVNSWFRFFDVMNRLVTNHHSGSFLRRQLSIDNYHVKKYVKESQFLLFLRQKVYKNAKFVYITEILWRTFWRDHFLTL